MHDEEGVRLVDDDDLELDATVVVADPRDRASPVTRLVPIVAGAVTITCQTWRLPSRCRRALRMNRTGFTPTLCQALIVLQGTIGHRALCPGPEAWYYIPHRWRGGA